MATRDNISTTAGSATPACSFGTLPSVASCVIVGWASWKSVAFTHDSVADNQGGTYTQIGTTIGFAGGGGQIRVSLWKRDNISAPGGTFTVTCTASATCDSRIVIAEYASMPTTTLDQSATGTGTSAAASATLAATTNAYDVIVGVVTSNGAATVTLTEDATNLPTLVRENEDNASNQCINVAERTVSSTGTYTGSWTVTSSTWGVVVAALMATPPAPAGISQGSPTWPMPHPPFRVA